MILMSLFSRVLNMSLAAGVVILLVVSARFLLRKSPKIFSYILWAAVLFRLLCPLALESRISVFSPFEPVFEDTTSPSQFDEVVYGVSMSQNEQLLVLQEPVEQPVVEEIQPEVPVLEIIWLAGMVGMLLYGLVGALRLKKHLNSAVWQRDNVFLTDCVGTPFVMGLVHPLIYLPQSISEDEKFYVLVHERYHIERLDHVVKLLAYLALSIHWFNPLVWVAFYLAEKDMEMSCDEAVMDTLGERVRADYALSLLCYTGHRRMARGTPLSFGESCAKSRVKNLVRWRSPGRLTEIIAGVLCVLLLLTCVTDPVAATADEFDSWAEEPEQGVKWSQEEDSNPVTIFETNRKEAQAYLGTWYMEGYYDVTLEVSEKYDSYTGQYALYLNFSKYAPKLPLTVQYDWRWDKQLLQYGIRLEGDQIATRQGQCVFVRHKGNKSILEDYPHLKAIGSWTGIDSPYSYAVMTRTANNRYDKAYYLRVRVAQENYRGYPAHDWEYINGNYWFSNMAEGHKLIVEDDKLKVSSSRRDVEFDLTENNIKYSGY